MADGQSPTERFREREPHGRSPVHSGVAGFFDSIGTGYESFWDTVIGTLGYGPEPTAVTSAADVYGSPRSLNDPRSPESLVGRKAAILAAYIATFGEGPSEDIEFAIANAATSTDLARVIRRITIDEIDDKAKAQEFTATYSQMVSGTAVEVGGQLDGETVLAPVWKQHPDDENLLINEQTGEERPKPAPTPDLVEQNLATAPPLLAPEDTLPYIGGGLVGPPTDRFGNVIDTEREPGQLPTFHEPEGINYRERLPQWMIDQFGFSKAAAMAGIDQKYLVDFTRPGAAKMRYFVGDEWEPASMSSIWKEYYKTKMVKAGYLDPDLKSGQGNWAQAEANALAAIMFESNGTGDTWTVRLDAMAANPSAAAENRLKQEARTGRQFSRAPFQTPAYVAPDINALTQDVKNYMRQRLRREPTAAEQARYIEALDADYAAEYGVQVAAARAEYQSQTSALEQQFEAEEEILAEEDGQLTEQVGPAASASPGTFRDVDPNARFQERFEQNFANELDLIKGTDDVLERTNLVNQAINRMNSLFGQPQGVR